MKEDNKKIWESHHAAGRHVMSYPYGDVVSCVFRLYGKHTDKSHLKVLEVGSGTGNNLWFFAREGFQTYGVEISRVGVRIAQVLLKNEGLKAQIMRGSFTNLSNFKDNFFDLVLDRHALYTVGTKDFFKAIAEIRRVLKKDGYFLSFMYSDKSACIQYGEKIEENTYQNFTKGPFVDAGTAHFVNEKEIKKDVYRGYDIKYMKRVRYDNVYPAEENEIEIFITLGKKK